MNAGRLEAPGRKWTSAVRRAACAALWLVALATGLGSEAQQRSSTQEPPQARAARRFLMRRGWTQEHGIAPMASAQAGRKSGAAQALGRATAMGTSTSSTWTALGPTAVSTSSYGLITGRVTALAFDPSDATGNKLYVGTSGGGVWRAQNAATSTVSSISFSALTDTVSALSGATDASISIGALAVQPGGTGVILAGTGDVNDLLDSYYGAGILRSTDSGNTWTLVTGTNDVATSLGVSDYTFAGEGFAGFAWSTSNTQLVVAAVSEAYGGSVRNAEYAGVSYRGLFYSTDAGATWHQATIMDGSSYVQGPLVSFASPSGNAATSVVWNPIRGKFIAAIRYHGYYESSDGKTWTRMSSQPGTNLTTAKCPTNLGSTGSTGCPIYRGTLAVNPSNGDTFAWTVDAADLDQGIWQDACTATSSTSGCVSSTMSFSTKLSTTSLETTVSGGTTGIANGSYTLALAAVPQDQDTILFAGANDLWRCSLAAGCVWRNTTNALTCASAGVAPYQHAIAFNASNTAELFIGNDSGLWRSMDTVGETGSVCASTDASHFQNLNGTLGSLADVESMAPVFTTPYTLMAGLGVNGVTGVKAATTTTDWPQILGGYGGPVDIDPDNTSNWYVNDQTGVGIYACSQSSACTTSDFGTSPVVDSSDVSGDGDSMDQPAPFLVDPLDNSQLLVGTCRVWRGAASGSGWSSTNALSDVLDGGSSTGACQGDGLIGTMAAMTLTAGGEEIYVGMHGSYDGGGDLAGHVLKAKVSSTTSGTVSWTDITGGTVSNDTNGMNAFGYGISSIYIDPHDGTGKTVYVTVEGIQTPTEKVRTLYRTTDGGTTWTDLTANLPESPANAVLVDPQDSGTIYVATDVGVYSTSDLSSCLNSPYTCWSIYGSGLPKAPVISLRSTSVGVSNGVLVAGTFGRGIWQTALTTAGTTLTTATASPTALDFGSETVGSTSAAQTVTVTNTGTSTLTTTEIELPDAYLEQDTCVGKTLAAGGTCTISVSFDPPSTGAQDGTMVIKTNVSGGQLTVALTGTGVAGGTMTATPVKLDFGSVAVGSTSSAQSTMVTNSGTSSVTMTSATASTNFAVSSDLCSGTTLASGSSCQIKATFTPTAASSTTGTLTVAYSTGSLTVALTGTGTSAASDALSASSLTFPSTAVGTLSSAQTVTLTNSGGQLLKSIAITASGAFEESDTCGEQLTAGSSCTISVVFAPTTTGSQTGTLTVVDALQTQTVALSGTGVATPAFSVSPASMTFSNSTVGVASAVQTLTVTNVGALSLANVGFQLTGEAASSYSLVSNTCGTTLAAGASCTVGVVFTPTSSSVISAVLSVSSSTANVAAVAVSLNGGLVSLSGLTASPTSVSFGTVGVGNTATAQTVAFTNTSGYTIDAPTLTISSPFTLTNNTCTGTVAANSSCQATVNFTPTATGSYSGTLTASSSSLSDSLSVAVTGIGFDFTVALSGANSVTVAAGQTASFTMLINTVSGSAGTFTYSYACGTLPSYALCTFNPTTTTAAAGNTGYVTITISTGKATSARRNAPAGWMEAPLSYAFLLLPLLVARRRRKVLTLLVLLMVAILAVSGCASAGLSSSSGSSGSGTSGTTPAGTYSIPVTVTTSGVSHSVTVTVTVV